MANSGEEPAVVHKETQVLLLINQLPQGILGYIIRKTCVSSTEYIIYVCIQARTIFSNLFELVLTCILVKVVYLFPPWYAVV